MKIVSIPHPSLRTIAAPVKSGDKEVRDKASALIDTLRQASNPPGIGLAAPQVNWAARVFVLWVERHKPAQVLINPEIRATSKKLTLGPNKKKPLLEGCLSIKDLYAPVYRYDWIIVDYQMLTDQGLVETTQRYDAFAARVVQHEMDHLDGILFTDHALRDELPIYRDTGSKFVGLDASELAELAKV